MFRHLSVGQWVLFVILSLFTLFGGFLYVAVEAHYNRRDRDFYVTPAGQELLGQEVQDRVARAQAKAVRPSNAPPFVAYVVIAILAGWLAIKMAMG